MVVAVVEVVVEARMVEAGAEVEISIFEAIPQNSGANCLLRRRSASTTVDRNHQNNIHKQVIISKERDKLQPLH
jgi:hypothetical protein